MKTATGPARPSAAGALRLAAAGACVLAVAALGCGGSGTGTVSGKVTYLGRPLTSGTVSCVTKDNHPFLGKIESDGAYTVTGVPTGPVTISVDGGGAAAEPPVALPDKDHPPPQMRPPASNPKPPAGVELPKQYTNPDTSGLKLTVVRGANSFNIDLK